MATQSKKRTDTSFFIDSQATVGQDSIDNPNANLDNPTSNATYDIASQVTYPFIDALENTNNVTNEVPLVEIEDDAEAMPADSTSIQNHASLVLNSEQISDTPTDSDNLIDNAYDDAANPDIISDVENNATDAPIENLESGSDQAIIAADVTDETAVVNGEPDFYFSSGSMLTNDYISFGSFAIASIYNMVRMDASFVMYGEQNDTPIDIEDTVNNTSTDNSLTGYINFSEQPIVDYAAPVDFMLIEETVTEEPFIFDVASCYEEFTNLAYNPDEIVNGDTDPVTDLGLISIDLLEPDSEVTEEVTDNLFVDSMKEPIPQLLASRASAKSDNLFVDSMKEPIEEYQTPNDVIVCAGGDISDGSSDNNTDPLTEVTDELFITHSSFTTHYGILTAPPRVVLIASGTLELKEGADLTLTLAIDDNRINNLTIDDAFINDQTEVVSDAFTIIPLGLPVSADWIA